jgi:hypothetical protein
MAEIPNIKANYEKYQHHGFDVIGISLDQMNSRELAEFVDKEGVRWTICRNADSPKNMADYYGIQSIPQLILVGRDGKVITLNARGPALSPAVEKALAAAGGGPAAENLAGGNDEGGPKPKKGDETAAKPKKVSDRTKAEEQAALKEKRELAAKAQERKARTWTDASGKFQVTAKFRGMVNKIVKLEREDGSVISLPLEKLSDDDQECIRLRDY